MLQVLTNGFFSLGTSPQALYRHIIRREKNISSPRNIDNRDSLYEMFVYYSRCFQEATSSFSRFEQVRSEISFAVFKWFLWKAVYAFFLPTALGLSHPFSKKEKHLPRKENGVSREKFSVQCERGNNVLYLETPRRNGTRAVLVGRG